nr:G protein-coupled receptor [Proales similis]
MDHIINQEHNATKEQLPDFMSLIDLDLLRLETSSLILVFVLAFFGNLTAVIILITRHLLPKRRLRVKFTRMNFFILNLSLADIYVCIGNVLPTLFWRMNNNLFFGGEFFCKVISYTQVTSIYYSTYVLVSMSIDRYEAICKPFSSLSWTFKRGFLFIFASFVLSHLQGIPQPIFFAIRDIPGIWPDKKTCYAHFPSQDLEMYYLIYTLFMQFCIPLGLIIASYSRILKQLMEQPFNSNRSDVCLNEKQPNEISELVESPKKMVESQSKTIEPNTSSEENIKNFQNNSSKRISKSKMKTVKLTLTVIVLYIVCSTPYFFAIFLNYFFPIKENGFTKYAIVISAQLFQLNSCVNPWIYLYFNMKTGKKSRLPQKNSTTGL